MSHHGEPSRTERIERWLDKGARKVPSERAKKIGNRLDKGMHWFRGAVYVVALIPLLAALYQYQNPMALIEVKGEVPGKGIPQGTTVQQVYVSLDDPSVGQRLSMASPWLVLALVLTGVVLSLRYVEKRTERTEGNPFPGIAIVVLVVAELAVAFGMWFVMLAGVLSRGSVGEPGTTDGEVVLVTVLTLVMVTMYVTAAIIQLRGNEEHKKLEDIV